MGRLKYHSWFYRKTPPMRKTPPPYNGCTEILEIRSRRWLTVFWASAACGGPKILHYFMSFWYVLYLENVETMSCIVKSFFLWFQKFWFSFLKKTRKKLDPFSTWNQGFCTGRNRQRFAISSWRKIKKNIAFVQKFPKNSKIIFIWVSRCYKLLKNRFVNLVPFESGCSVLFCL